jgi:DNA-binding response OmpR family regulator
MDQPNQNRVRTVLLAEDNQFIQRGYKAAIEEAGYAVITVSNGADVVPHIVEHLPDIVVLDLILPNKTGFDILKELRADDRFRTLPIIVATSLGQDEDRQKADALGATDYLIKSHVTIHTLITKIDTALGV